MDGAGLLVHEGGSRLEDCTNNPAEYQALIEALGWVEANLGHDFQLEVRMDSEFIVKQLRGEYKVKDPNMKPLHAAVMEALRGVDQWSIRHVKRHLNAEADRLVNEALDAG